jgi:hypothetical protein
LADDDRLGSGGTPELPIEEVEGTLSPNTESTKQQQQLQIASRHPLIVDPRMQRPVDPRRKAITAASTSTAASSSTQPALLATRPAPQISVNTSCTELESAADKEPFASAKAKTNKHEGSGDEAAADESLGTRPLSAISPRLRQLATNGELLKPHTVRDLGIRQHFSDHPRTIVSKLPILPQIFTQGWFECPYAACQFVLERPHAYNFIREIRTHLKVHRTALLSIGKQQSVPVHRFC